MNELRARLIVQRTQFLQLASVLRAQRMKSFVKLMHPSKNARIVDLGGTAALWNLFHHEFDVTLVNLPPAVKTPAPNSSYKIVYADACNLREVFDSKVFDIAFSNSVIEHVGDDGRQISFSLEARRLAHHYWIQTPSPRFPIEAHTGVPFYWQGSAARRTRMQRRWDILLPDWAQMTRELRVLSAERLLELFPESLIYRERLLGMEKSTAAYLPMKGR